MTRYQHGGDIAAFARACGCSRGEVIDLSSNINFVKPHISTDFNTLQIAPYPNYDALYNAIASHYSVESTTLELFNGGSSAIFSFFRELSTAISVCTIYSPAYLEYKKAATLFGYRLHLIDRFTHLDTKIPGESLVIFVNPATPDGKFYDMEPLLEMWHAQECLVLIDESFIEFTSHPSATRFLKQYPNLTILKSMTKFFGAAGIRMGTLISHPDNITRLRAKEPLWKLSAFDSTYIQLALKDSGFKERSDRENHLARTFLLDSLENSPLVEKIYPSEANYILVRLHISTGEFQQKLITHRLLVRNCMNFDGLDDHHVRIAVKSIGELRQLKEVLHA
ncbi:aminotransferase class I/II [Sulfurovum lithotrophicum]|uniref:Aminotransferase n=1 Tax=Sulfurovum lithotrophicum TaxID=206403 RepID=A0A7U4M1R4_9BACT|nr:aminotransferase class I/II-fold pyridoxal phosphate-dependent enzyme [Sulfurovum lithotrophicum]AKF25227.1 aminotransferase class I/II [Sulfurovum lithotrophicum]